jgi:hypothetical protein
MASCPPARASADSCAMQVRRIGTDNAAIAGRVLSAPGGQALLEALGWTVSGGAMRYTHTSTALLSLAAEDIDEALSAAATGLGLSW